MLDSALIKKFHGWDDMGDDCLYYYTITPSDQLAALLTKVRPDWDELDLGLEVRRQTSTAVVYHYDDEGVGYILLTLDLSLSFKVAEES